MRSIAAFLALALLQTPAALPPTRDQLFATFGSYLDSLRIQTGIPGLAAAIVEGDNVVWDQAFGQQDIGRSLGARSDTPFHFDGLTETLTATLVLRCVEDGRMRLDATVGSFNPGNPDASLTVGQVLSHTSGDPANPTFAYRPDRLNALTPAIAACKGMSFRGAVATLLDQLAMFDSVPGADAIADPVLAVDRYTSVLLRLAVPYAVDAQGRPSASHYPSTTLTPSTGLISTVLNFAQFDRALRQGVLIRSDTLSAAWRPRSASAPHGYGWFVQSVNGELVVWQFGNGPNASSSLLITIPGRGITLILAANSDGLARPASRLAEGDVTASPFARMFFQVLVK